MFGYKLPVKTCRIKRRVGGLHGEGPGCWGLGCCWGPVGSHEEAGPGRPLLSCTGWAGAHRKLPGKSRGWSPGKCPLVGWGCAGPTPRGGREDQDEDGIGTQVMRILRDGVGFREERVHRSAHAHMHTHTYAYAHTHVHARIHAHAYASGHTHTCTPACAHTYAHVHMHTHAHAYTSMHVHTHTREIGRAHV